MQQGKNSYNLSLHVNDFLMTYDDLGEGNVPLIFLHGFPFEKSMWQAQIDFLKSTYRVIAIDLRGFGQSKDETSKLSMEGYADDLMAFMDELKIEKAIICGFSMGGYIALNALQRYAGRFEAIILCDTQCNADSAESKEKRLNAIREIETEGAEKFNTAFIKNLFSENTLVNNASLVEQMTKVVFSNSPHILTAGLAALAARSETCTTLSEKELPALIICGKEDKLTPPAQAELMHARLKDSILHIIDNAGHVANMENAAAFNAQLEAFLQSIMSSGSQ